MSPTTRSKKLLPTSELHVAIEDAIAGHKSNKRYRNCVWNLEFTPPPCHPDQVEFWTRYWYPEKQDEGEGFYSTDNA